VKERYDGGELRGTYLELHLKCEKGTIETRVGQGKLGDWGRGGWGRTPLAGKRGRKRLKE